MSCTIAPAAPLHESSSFERHFPGVQEPLNAMVAALLASGSPPIAIGIALMTAGAELLLLAGGPNAVLDSIAGLRAAFRAQYQRESALHEFQQPVDDRKGRA